MYILGGKLNYPMFQYKYIYPYAVLSWFYSVIRGKFRKWPKSYYSLIIPIVGDLKYKVQSEQ